MPCLECARQLYEECELDKCDCLYHSPVLPIIPQERKGKESHYDKNKEFKDAASTGRHRAALLYPYICDSCGHTKSQHADGTEACTKEVCDCSLYKWSPCEWRNTGNNGGGRNPTIGCGDGIGTDRHHGPIKDPLRNELGNVHRICSKCHQRWHMLNDNYYDEKEAMMDVHDPQPATDKEILQNELRWSDGWFNRNFDLKKISGRIESD
jgi:hypothetical protein